MSTPTERKAVDRHQAAVMYGVSFDTIKRAVNTGALKAKRIGRRVGIDVADLASWWESLPDA